MGCDTGPIPRTEGGTAGVVGPGVHHLALVVVRCGRRRSTSIRGCSEFPLTELFENRDYEGSTHFFFDIGNGNAWPSSTSRGSTSEPYAEVLGGLHHLAISVEPQRWEHLKAKLDEAGVDYAHVDETSIYFAGPTASDRTHRRSARRDVRQVGRVAAPMTKPPVRLGGVPEHFNLPWHLAIDSPALANLEVEWAISSAAPARCWPAWPMARGIVSILTEGTVSAIARGLDALIIQVYVASPLQWGSSYRPLSSNFRPSISSKASRLPSPGSPPART